MKGHRWHLLLLIPFLTGMVLLSNSHPVAAFTSSDADSAMTAYVITFYDATAHYFYADTKHSSYNDFWKEAQSWDIVMDAYQRTQSSTYRQMIDDVYNGFMARHSDMSTACNTSNSFKLTDKYNDDIGWWAKASIRAYQITGEPRYKNCAKRLFDFIYMYWNTGTLGGGIWWTNSNPAQKNIATNATAVITAANLSISLSDSSYLAKAQTIYNWVKAVLTNKAGTVYDNYNSGKLSTAQFSYNYGTFIEAAVALYQATSNSSYLSDASAAASVSLRTLTTNGILNDESAGDRGGFKGIYVRYLEHYARVANASQYTTFLQKNASVAWSNRRSIDNLIGTNWAVEARPGPIDVHTFGSAVALLQDVPADDITSLQAENGTLHNLRTETSNVGYHGSGYVAGWYQNGQWVDLSANITRAGRYRLIMRFATGAGNASRRLYVNGNGVVNNLVFPNTGSWRSYATMTVNNVSLNAGNNIISIIYNSSLGSSNYLNLDEVTVIAQ